MSEGVLGARDPVGSGDDPWSAAISRFVAHARPATAPVRTAAGLRIADTVGCALGATDSPAVVAAMRYAADVGGRVASGPGHALWGEQMTVRDADTASLVNGVKVRYLDFNDAYHGREPIHPSDVIPTIYATAVEHGVSADRFVDAVIVGYEVAMNAADLIAPTPRGFDHVNVTMLGAVAGCCRVLELDAEGTAHALSIAVTSHVALRRTRAGGLNLWKAFAAADAARHARYATALARAGVEGPPHPFVGRSGMFEMVLGLRADEVGTPVFGAAPSRIMESQLKAFPCGSTAQAPTEAALELVRRGIRLEDVASLEIRVGPEALALHAGPDKLLPRTREAADHSIPYVVVSTLALGALTEASFDEVHVGDVRLQEFLARRVHVIYDESLDAGHHAGFPVALDVLTRDGASHQLEVSAPEGSPANPMTPSRARTKFLDQVGRSRIAERAEELWRATLDLGAEHGGLEVFDQLLRAPD